MCLLYVPQDWHQCSTTAWQRHYARSSFMQNQHGWAVLCILARQRSTEIGEICNMELCGRPPVIVMCRRLLVWICDFLLDLCYNSIWNNTVCLYKRFTCFCYAIFARSALTHTLLSYFFSAVVFIKCNNLRLCVLHGTWTCCTSSGGRYWLVIKKLDCYGLTSVFFSVTIVIIIIFRFMYKSSIFWDSDLRINILFWLFLNLTCMIAYR